MTSRFHVWWRPVRTIFEPQKVLQIRKQVEAIPIDRATSIDLNLALGDNSTSAFLWPILATEGEKGSILLRRYLVDYANGAQLDDRWLLMVAALGMNPCEESENALERELDRVVQHYPVTQPARQADPRMPLLDALLACRAGRQTLSADQIEQLCRIAPSHTWRLWLAGLEWTHRLMPEKAILDLIEKGLAARTDEELADAMNLRPSSDRLRAIQVFLYGPKSIWPLARTVLLRDVDRRKTVADYLLVVYSFILVSQADESRGRYEIDPLVISKMVSGNVRNCRFLSHNCRILQSCAPSTSSPDWEAFLSDHAGRLHPDDAKQVAYMVDRLLGPLRSESRNLYSESRPYDHIAKPGVHLLGFAEAGGPLPAYRATAASQPGP